jgi:hypothetical protein
MSAAIIDIRLYLVEISLVHGDVQRGFGYSSSAYFVEGKFPTKF